jgi:hypothetical protein
MLNFLSPQTSCKSGLERGASLSISKLIRLKALLKARIKVNLGESEDILLIFSHLKLKSS